MGRKCLSDPEQPPLILDAIDGDVVDAECSTFMSSFVESHGKNRVKPKRHYQMHIPAQIRRDRGRLWDAFAGERKNKTVLAMAENIRNTKTFERSVLQTLIASTCQKLCQDDALSQKLSKPARPAECLVGLLPEWGSVVPTISNAAHISGRKICIGELVVPNGERDAFLIHACVSAHSWFGVIAERCAFVESVSRFAKRFKRCNRISVVRLEGFVAVDIWYYPDVSQIVTLWPRGREKIPIALAERFPTTAVLPRVYSGSPPPLCSCSH